MTFHAAPTGLYLNGVDTAQLGFILDSIDGVFDGVDRSDPLLQFPQGVGAHLSDVPGQIAPRTVTLSGTLPATTSTALESAKDALKAVCAEGLVDIRLVHRDVVLRGRLTALAVAHSEPQLRTANAAARVSLRFTCPDPFAWSRAPQCITIGSLPVSLPLGTAPSRGRRTWSAVITIFGPATTPTLTEHDAAGNTLRQMAFTWNPTASDAIEIDVGRGLVTRIQSGVRDNGLSYLSAGYAFPALDPADGDYRASAWPKLSVSSGAARARYFQGWR